MYSSCSQFASLHTVSETSDTRVGVGSNPVRRLDIRSHLSGPGDSCLPVPRLTPPGDDHASRQGLEVGTHRHKHRQVRRLCRSPGRRLLWDRWVGLGPEILGNDVRRS